MSTPLGAEIAALIRETGPIGIDRYMALCLGHPVHGYYRTRDPLGARGDFTTSPEISQVFGEVLGLWSAVTWTLLGRPSPVALIEAGPGRGTLMADALRALRAAASGARLAVHLVETSPVLRAAQEARLAGTGAVWHGGIDTLPAGPMIVLANEFLDCLPVRQFQRTGRGWCERVVGLVGDRLAFGLAPDPLPEIEAEAPEGALMTLPSAGLDLVRALSRRLGAAGGALLAIDYGHARSGFGDTLQALAGHAFADPLAAPGEADLTAHVDFGALARAAAAEGAAVHGPATQRDFLLAMGLAARAERLKARAGADQARAIDAAAERLTDPAERGMGGLFKVLALADPRLGP